MLPAGFSLDSEGSRCGLPRDRGGKRAGIRTALCRSNNGGWKGLLVAAGATLGAGRPPSAIARHSNEKQKAQSRPGEEWGWAPSLSGQLARWHKGLKKKQARIQPQRSTQSRKEVSNIHTKQKLNAEAITWQ